jgi:hypothetical protein
VGQEAVRLYLVVIEDLLHKVGILVVRLLRGQAYHCVCLKHAQARCLGHVKEFEKPAGTGQGLVDADKISRVLAFHEDSREVVNLAFSGGVDERVSRRIVESASRTVGSGARGRGGEHQVRASIEDVLQRLIVRSHPDCSVVLDEV